MYRNNNNNNNNSMFLLKKVKKMWNIKKNKNSNSNIFQVPFKMVQKMDGTYDVICNYYREIYKF